MHRGSHGGQHRQAPSPWRAAAFVPSGGGSLGAVQVGMLQALAAAGIERDVLIATSAGGINAAWVGARGMSIPQLG